MINEQPKKKWDIICRSSTTISGCSYLPVCPGWLSPPHKLTPWERTSHHPGTCVGNTLPLSPRTLASQLQRRLRKACDGADSRIPVSGLQSLTSLSSIPHGGDSLLSLLSSLRALVSTCCTNSVPVAKGDADIIPVFKALHGQRGHQVGMEAAAIQGRRGDKAEPNCYHFPLLHTL